MLDKSSNDQKKENFVEPSMVLWETAKCDAKKEEFVNQRGLKRQKGKESKNGKNSFASQEDDICELLIPQENYKEKKRVSCSVCGKIFKYKFHLNIH
ncbi:hypothetical protein JD844_013932, partial [Phrynosoma platyrhinos]